MSGHSKWSQIKRQKAVSDQKKGNIFTKLGNAISIAARHGGKDPSMNFHLRVAIDTAKAANMPNDNIDRAVARGVGEVEGMTLEEVTYEGFGPHGVAIMIDVTTDNKNRTAPEIRSILAKYNGSLGNAGSVAWMFNKKGVIRVLKNTIKDKDDFTLKIIDAGAEDISEEEEGITILTQPQDLQKANTAIQQLGLTPVSTAIEMVPTNKVKLPNDSAKESLTKLLEELDTNDDVNNYFTNADTE